MKFTEKETVLGVVKDTAITVGIVAGVGLGVCMVPKILKYMDASIALQWMNGTHKAADSVRMLSLASKYDVQVAREAMEALPRLMAKF